MLKRSASEKVCPARVRAFGVKVLPSVFRRPALKSTGLATSRSFDNAENNGCGIRDDPSSDCSTAPRAEAEMAETRWDPAPPPPPRSRDDLDLEELTEKSERDPTIDGRTSRTPRQPVEQDRKRQERIGLDEMLKICADYEKQTQFERAIAHQTQSLKTERRSSPRLCSVTKIKTNGSLTSSSAHVRRFVDISKHPNGHSDSNSTQFPAENPRGIDPEFGGNSSVSEENPDRVPFHSEFPSTRRSPVRANSVYENAQSGGEAVKPFQVDSSGQLNGRMVANDDHHQHQQHQPPSQKPRTIISQTVRSSGTQGTSVDADETNERIKRSFEKLKEEKMESAERLERIKIRLEDFEKREETTLKELECKMKVLESESMEEMTSFRLEVSRMTVIKEQQAELLLEATEEREKFKQQIQAEKRKLEELEERCKSSRRRVKTNADPDLQTPLQLEAKRDREAMELQQRIFDDLEFSLLELETRHEEEREPVLKTLATELDSLLNMKYQREESLCRLEQHRLEITRQAKEEETNLEKERHQLISQFKKERLVYLALVDQMKKTVSISRCCDNAYHASLQNENLYSSVCRFCRTESLIDEDLCKTPQLRVRKWRTPLSQEPTDNQSVGQPAGDHSITDAVIEGVRSGSQSEEMDNGQLSPSSKVFSSGSEDSSFNSLDELLHSDTSRSETNSHNKDTNDQEKNELRSTQGNRSVSRSLSEPISKKLEATCTVFSLASTDEEIRYRDNRNQPAQARPLTRYLPVRDKNLDLRSFVESSGHSLDEISQVLVTPSTCCGYLKKQGGKFRTWHKRWFIFDRNKRCLMCYSDRTEAKLRRCIYFQTIVDVFVDHLRTVVSPNPKLTFCLKTLDRRFYLVAPTGEAMRIWIDVLFTGAEGYQEFW